MKKTIVAMLVSGTILFPGLSQAQTLCSGQLNPDTQLSRFSASAGGIPSLC